MIEVIDAHVTHTERWSLRERTARHSPAGANRARSSVSVAALSLALALTGGLGLGACSVAPAAAVDGSAVIAAPDANPTAVGCTDPEPGVLDFVDNMEDGDAQVLFRNGRNGSWYTFHDPTTGTLNPDMNTVVAMETIPDGRCAVSTHAMRVTGSGFTEWGSGFGFSFKSALVDGKYTSGPYDASAAQGITFWARIGETSVNTIRIGIGDEWSVPQGGHCDITQTSGDTACYDSFGSSLTLTPLWKRYTLRFGEQQQRAFGTPRPSLSVSSVHLVEFAIPPSAPVFDVWVDDIALF